VNNIAKRQLSAMLSVTVVLLIGLSPVFAHHSDSVYDQDRFITVKGTVTQFEFVNPHVLIHVAAKDDKGNLVQWTTLGGPPNRMAKGAGWTHSTIKEGEELTITGYPFRDGRPVMLFQMICRADGQQIPMSETVTAFSTRQGKNLSCADTQKAK
jgi:uncharacterized protein DUF6152